MSINPMILLKFLTNYYFKGFVYKNFENFVELFIILNSLAMSAFKY